MVRHRALHHHWCSLWGGKVRVRQMPGLLANVAKLFVYRTVSYLPFPKFQQLSHSTLDAGRATASQRTLHRHGVLFRDKGGD